MAGWVEDEVGSRHLARRSAERRRIEEALRLGAADLFGLVMKTFQKRRCNECLDKADEELQEQLKRNLEDCVLPHKPKKDKKN